MADRINRRRFLTAAAAASLPLAFPFRIDAEEAPSPKRRIFASGGGFMSPSNTLLMDYLLMLTGKKDPIVCLLSTPQGDSALAIMLWYEFMNAMACRPRHLRVFGGSAQMKAFEPQLLISDVIFVGPGSTLNAMALWKAHGVEVMLRKAWEKGIILSGESAGLVRWFEQGVTDSRPEQLTAMEGLGFLKGSVCPHYDSERERRPSYHRMLKAGEIKEGLGSDNWVGLLYEGQQLTKVVASRPEKTAYRVRLQGGEVVEEPLPVELLGKKP